MAVKKSSVSKKSKTEKVKPLFALLCALDDLCHGTKVGRTARHELLHSIEKMYQTSVYDSSEIQNVLSLDLTLPNIRRNFPEYVGDPQNTVNVLQENPGLQGLFLSVLTLSHFEHNDDLVTDILELAEAMETIRQVRVLIACFNLIKAGKRVIPEHLFELQFLRAIANQFTLAGALYSLPEVTVGLTEKSEEYKEIIAAIRKFPVQEELESAHLASSNRFTLLLEDIADIFVDYPIGEVRKAALMAFPKTCKRYINIVPLV